MVVLSRVSLLLPSLQSSCLPCTKLVLMHICCCCCSVAQWCPALCNPMDCSTPGFPALHHLPELTQTHVHWVSDHLILCHPLLHLPSLFPNIRVISMSQLFASGGQSIGASASASVLLMNIQDWFPLGLTRLISLQAKGPSRVFSNTTVQKHPFFGAQPSLWSNSHICIWLLEKPYLWLYDLCHQSDISAF